MLPTLHRLKGPIMNVSKPMYFGGQLHDGVAQHEVINPATGEVAGIVAVADAELAVKALEQAQLALDTWSTTTVTERVQWMNKLRQAIIAHELPLRECIHQEMGKAWASTQGDYQMLVDSLAFYAEEISQRQSHKIEDIEGTHSHEIVHEPVGVVAAFLAWNFPLLNLAYKLAPAMAAGCPIVVKPSLKTPLSALLVGELCAQIGLPAGAVNIICGPDQLIGDAMSASTIPALITLIGSTETGKHVMRVGATSIKRYSMELGGNAPVLVFADADLDLAASVVCGLKFENAGQICVAPNRVFVAQSVAADFLALVKQKTQAVKVGFNKNLAIDMGPVIDQGAWQRIDQMVQDAVADGAKLEMGGARPAELSEGSFYSPTVLTNVKPTSRICRDEVFGPVISILNFTDETEVLAQANDTEAGLSSFIFTQNIEKAQSIANKLRFGEVHINGVKYAINLPHCGVKQSGVGVDCSSYALDEYFTIKRVSRALLTERAQ